MKLSLPDRINSIFIFITVNVLRNILGIVRSKIIAIYYGIAEIGLLGQFISIYNLQIKFVTFGTSAAIINSYNLSDQKGWSKETVLFVNLLIIFIANIINTILIFIFLNWLSFLIYGGTSYSFLLLLGLILNFIYSISIFLELTLQARQQFKVLALGRGLAIFVAIIAVIPLAYFYKVQGVIFDMVLLYTISFIYFIYKFKFVKYLNFQKIAQIISDINKEILRYIFKVALTDLIRAVFILGGLFLVRIIILQLFSITYSGYYQALISISNYVNVLAEGFIVYYFPVISSCKEDDVVNKEININFEILLYIITPLILIMIIASEQLLVILFSSEFIHLSWELSWLIFAKMFYFFYYFYSINFLAKNYLRKFVFLEASRSLFLILATFVLSKYFNFLGAISALFITDFFSMITVVIMTRKLEFFKLSFINYKKLAGAVFICLVSIIPLFNIWIKIALVFPLFYWFMGFKKYRYIIDYMKGSLKNK